jgi:methylase of polypeptide subunit release factors
VKNRKLNNLSDHIKCGNSLIDDKSVAGDLAFDWNKEFSTIMRAGGFDVVVGNPPYVRADSAGNSVEFRNYMMRNTDYKTLAGKWDIYIAFIEKAIHVLKKLGYSSLELLQNSILF